VGLIETGHGGRNALDSILNLHTGKQSVTDPQGYFHILSKDKDFDPVIRHLRDNNIFAARHNGLDEIPVLMNEAERVHVMTAKFAANPNARPKSRDSLRSAIQAQFGRVLSDDELDGTIAALMEIKAIEMKTTGVVNDKI